MKPETATFVQEYDIAFYNLYNCDELEWDEISQSLFTEQFIRTFNNKVNWQLISQPLYEDFILEFHKLVDWENISYCQSLTETFIRDFEDLVDWKLISRYQNISEDFIREFQDCVDWKK
jgi:hypothetical protein